MSVVIFTNNSPIEDALHLPKGRLAANFGFWVEQGVEPDNVLKAAEALLKSEEEFRVASQAAVIAKAQELKIAFDDWAELRVM